MTTDEAEALGTKALEVIQGRMSVFDRKRLAALEADRCRISGDLAGLRYLDAEVQGCCTAASYETLRMFFLDNLRRTAALYGVTDA